MLFVKLMTFFLFCLELCNLQMNCEPAFMPELLKKFVACMGTLSTAHTWSRLWATRLRKVVSLHFCSLLNNEFDNSCITSGSFWSYWANICVALCCPLPRHSQLA